MQNPLFNWNLLSSNEKKEETNPKSKLDKRYEQFIDSEAEGLLESDEAYEFQSTPLKPAKAIKADHKRRIREELDQKKLRGHIVKAYDLIMDELPQRVSPSEFDQLKLEFEKSLDHFYEISQKPIELDQKISYQELYGISDESMILIYSLASAYLEEQAFENAESLLYFLALLNPAVSSFWVGLGISLQNQDKDEEAKIMFEIAQVFNSVNS